jgi:uncharacterized coiled-coil DUF342 family protein
VSEESDVKIIVELAHLSSAVRQYGEGQGRLLQQSDELKTEVRSIRTELAEVRGQAAHAVRLANEAKRATDENASESRGVHRSWEAHAEKTTKAIDALRADTEAQTATLTRQDTVLEKLLDANEKAELHREWQRNQAAEADAKTTKRRATVTWALGIVTAVLAIAGGAYGLYRAMGPSSAVGTPPASASTK